MVTVRSVKSDHHKYTDTRKPSLQKHTMDAEWVQFTHIRHDNDKDNTVTRLANWPRNTNMYAYCAETWDNLDTYLHYWMIEELEGE